METGEKGNDRAKKGPRSKESAVNARTATCGWRGVRLLGKPRNWLVPVDLQRLRVASLRHKGEPGQHHPDPASSSLGVVRSLQKMCRHERMRMTTDRSSNTHKASAQRTQVLRSDDCLLCELLNGDTRLQCILQIMLMCLATRALCRPQFSVRQAEQPKTK